MLMAIGGGISFHAWIDDWHNCDNSAGLGGIASSEIQVEAFVFPPVRFRKWALAPDVFPAVSGYAIASAGSILGDEVNGALERTVPCPAKLPPSERLNCRRRTK